MATQLATPQPTVLAPIHPNASIRAAYQRQLDAMVKELSDSVTFWVSAQWRKNTPEMAQDASPAADLRAAMRKLSNRWMKKFNDGADKLANLFADKTLAYTDVRWTKQLRDIGFSVRPTMTASVQDAYSAVIGENVGLIRSIAAQYLAQVETVVMQGVQTGRDLSYIHDKLRERYGITKRRAALIARDQNNKATATFTRTRQKDAGINKARWRHSHAGKEPRPEHVAADGKVYDVDKGMFLEGVWTWPGVEINCRCTSEPIIPGLEDEED
jgi:SPP1 gp7 family putative phage head morphogenesis protein